VSASLARIVGLDVARAIALLGMFASHVGNEHPPDGWPWLEVFHGRSAAIFAMLAGVSMALMLTRRAARDYAAAATASPAPADRAGRPEAHASDREALRHTRIRIAVRASLLIPLGWVLSALGTPVDVILDNLGVMMLLALVGLGLPARVLGAAGVLVLVAGTAVVDGLRVIVPAWLADAPVVHELWSQHYPALSWLGHVLIGMAIGTWRPWRGWRLAALGIGGAVVGAGMWLGGRLTGGDPAWTEVEPHSYTPVEMLSNTGVAAAVVAACLAAAALSRRTLWPLAAAGSMTLTLYAAHIVVIAIVGDALVWRSTNTAMLVLCAAAVAFASAWRALLGQGPLERVVSWASSRAADADARRRIGPPDATMSA